VNTQVNMAATATTAQGQLLRSDAAAFVGCATTRQHLRRSAPSSYVLYLGSKVWLAQTHSESASHRDLQLQTHLTNPHRHT
jgi:hypothetical protein